MNDCAFADWRAERKNNSNIICKRASSSWAAWCSFAEWILPILLVEVPNGFLLYAFGGGSPSDCGQAFLRYREYFV